MRWCLWSLCLLRCCNFVYLLVTVTLIVMKVKLIRYTGNGFVIMSLFFLPPTKEEVYVFARVRLSVCLSVCLLARSLKTRAWIAIKYCVSIDVRTWTYWLTFKLDPDHNPNLGTGFSLDFCISARYLKKLWTDFDDILCIDSCGDCMIWLGFEPDPDHSSDLRTGFTSDFFNFRGISEEVMDGFRWNFMRR